MCQAFPDTSDIFLSPGCLTATLRQREYLDLCFAESGAQKGNLIWPRLPSRNCVGPTPVPTTTAWNYPNNLLSGFQLQTRRQNKHLWKLHSWFYSLLWAPISLSVKKTVFADLRCSQVGLLVSWGIHRKLLICTLTHHSDGQSFNNKEGLPLQETGK